MNLKDKLKDNYDLILVGSSFASSFFLKKFLQNSDGNVKVLVLEWGQVNPHKWQIENGENSNIDEQMEFSRQGVSNKDWKFTLGFGGSSSCWTGCTPRMLPNDFRLKSAYGVGMDWPISYDELEQYYCEVEEVMQISGADDWSLSPMSKPFPQKPHRLNDIDRLIKAAYPEHYYAQATARARTPTENRPSCCSSAYCHLCPVNAKFTIQNELSYLYEDPRVDLSLNSKVIALDIVGGQAKGVRYEKMGEELRVGGDIIALGANAIFNAAILLRSGDKSPLLGKRIHEQISTTVKIDLKGVGGMQGSTLITGQGYMFYDGAHRSEYGACMTETANFLPTFRAEFGKWNHRVILTFIVEDLPLEENTVTLDGDGKPIITFEKYSQYGLNGLQQVPRYIEELSECLPIENVYYSDDFIESGLPRSSEWHIQGSVVMGVNAESGVIDKDLRHFQYKNVFVLGSSSFPTGAPANPTLTLSALSLKSAESIFS